jgi:FkbM family methyltransferase
MLDRRIVVADVGCRWGFAEDFLPDAESYTIYGFDPDHEECKRLDARYASSEIKAIPVALGSENAEKELYLTVNPACSSLYQPDPSLNSSHAAFHCQIETGKTTIHVRRLDDWAKENHVEVIDYLKIDTQGSDLDVLSGAGDLLPQIRCIQAEVMFNPMYLGQPLFADIDTFLRSMGFVLWRFSEVTHYSQNKTAQPPINTDMIKHDDWSTQTTLVYAGQIFWGNAYYINTSVLGNKVPDSQRKRDEILFSSLGLPDVLGDQQGWDKTITARSEKYQQRAQENHNALAAVLDEAQHAQAQAAKAEMEFRQAMDQLNAIHASTSWRITAPLRGLGQCLSWLRHRLNQSTAPCMHDDAPTAPRIKAKLKAGIKAFAASLIALINQHSGLRRLLVKLAHTLGVYAPVQRVYARLMSKILAPENKPTPSTPGNLSPQAMRMYRRMKSVAENQATTK